MPSIQLSAQITRISSRVDGSMGLSVATPELKDEEKLILLGLHGKEVTIAIFPSSQPPAPPHIVDKGMKKETTSQRLRRAVWALYKKEQFITQEFEAYYADAVNTFIAQIEHTEETMNTRLIQYSETIDRIVFSEHGRELTQRQWLELALAAVDQAGMLKSSSNHMLLEFIEDLHFAPPLTEHDEVELKKLLTPPLPLTQAVAEDDYYDEAKYQ